MMQMNTNWLIVKIDQIFNRKKVFGLEFAIKKRFIYSHGYELWSATQLEIVENNKMFRISSAGGAYRICIVKVSSAIRHSTASRM